MRYVVFENVLVYPKRRGGALSEIDQLIAKFTAISREYDISTVSFASLQDWMALFRATLQVPVYNNYFQALVPVPSYLRLTQHLNAPVDDRAFRIFIRDCATNMVEALKDLKEQQDTADTDPN